MRPVMRVYADTSVFGGAFDEEFQPDGALFFDLVRNRSLELVVCSTVRDELGNCPPAVWNLYRELAAYAKVVEVTRDAFDLQAAYIAARVVSARCETDALHVATATVSGCAMIVSWNFRHIVNYRRIPMYNAVNALNGYGQIAIHSPLEVVADEGDRQEQEGIRLR